MPSGASSGPSGVTVTPGVTNISIQWGEVDCVERNGEITGYSVRYGLSSSTLREIITVHDRMLKIDDLLIRTSYSFEVAAINGDGIGEYSSVINSTTAVPTGILGTIVTT